MKPKGHFRSFWSDDETGRIMKLAIIIIVVYQNRDSGLRMGASPNGNNNNGSGNSGGDQLLSPGGHQTVGGAVQTQGEVATLSKDSGGRP